MYGIIIGVTIVTLLIILYVVFYKKIKGYFEVKWLCSDQSETSIGRIDAYCYFVLTKLSYDVALYNTCVEGKGNEILNAYFNEYVNNWRADYNYDLELLDKCALLINSTGACGKERLLYVTNIITLIVYIDLCIKSLHPVDINNFNVFDNFQPEYSALLTNSQLSEKISTLLKDDAQLLYFVITNINSNLDEKVISLVQSGIYIPILIRKICDRMLIKLANPNKNSTNVAIELLKKSVLATRK
jgi:hypothetical protein